MSALVGAGLGAGGSIAWLVTRGLGSFAAAPVGAGSGILPFVMYANASQTLRLAVSALATLHMQAQAPDALHLVFTGAPIVGITA